MYAAGRMLSVSPREREIPLILSTQHFPDDFTSQFRECDLSFDISPSLQLSNAKWSIGLKSLTIPTRIKNFDSSFKIAILASMAVIEITLSDACHLSLKSIIPFLNQEVSSKTSYGANITFGVSGNGLANCLVTSPVGVIPFMVSFSRNLCSVLGFEANTVARGSPAGASANATKLCDPYADFKIITVKSSNADAYSTSQVIPNESQENPETTLAVVQVGSNYGIDHGSTLAIADSIPTSVHTVSIPMEGVVFYPLASQTLSSVKFKLFSQSSQLVKVDASLPVVIKAILRKSDHTFV